MANTPANNALHTTRATPSGTPKRVAAIAEVAPTIRSIQEALAKAGFDPGPIDGLSGPKTESALRAFRLAAGFANPVGATLSLFEPDMLQTLFNGKPPPTPPHDAPWIDVGWDKMLLHEKFDNASLFSWLRFGGRSVGDPSKIPWCGDFVETCISIALAREPLPKNPYLARNWLKFGKQIDQPAPGAIAVFYRGDPDGLYGHVGFYVSEDKKYLHILGGNQGKRISIARLDKKRLLGYRWPSTYAFKGPHVVTANRGGSVSINEA